MDHKHALENLKTNLSNMKASLSRLERIIGFVESLTSNGVLILTGSRSFGTHNIAADYDFFMSEEEFQNRHLAEILSEMGFLLETAGSYKFNPDDTSTMGVYRFNRGGLLFAIDIQVIKPEHFEAKKKAQKTLERFVGEHHDQFHAYGKYERSCLWAAAIKGEELPTL